MNLSSQCYLFWQRWATVLTSWRHAVVIHGDSCRREDYSTFRTWVCVMLLKFQKSVQSKDLMTVRPRPADSSPHRTIAEVQNRSSKEHQHTLIVWTSQAPGIPTTGRWDCVNRHLQDGSESLWGDLRGLLVSVGVKVRGEKAPPFRPAWRTVSDTTLRDWMST